MEYNRFESHLTGSLRDHTIAVDTDALIRAIHAEKPKDRKFLVWFLTFVGLAAVGYGFWAVSSAYSNTNSKVTKAQPASIADLETKNNIESSIAFESNQDITITSNPINNLISEKYYENVATQEELSKSSNANSSNNAIKTTQNTAPSILNLTDQDSKNTVMANNSTTNQVNLDVNFISIGSSPISNVRNIPSKALLIPSIETPLLGYKYSVRGRKVECPDFSISKNKWTFSLVPEIGAYYPLKSLSTIESNELYTARKDQERSLEGLASSLYLRATPKKWPIFIQSGISWHRHTEQMNFKYDYTLKDTIQGIISITVSQTGDTITTIWGDIIQDKRIYGQKKVHHSFRLVDIPVGAGIHKSIGQFKVGIDAGLLFNISMSSNGRLYNGDTTFAAIDALPTEVFKKSIGMQYYAGIFASRSLGVGELYLNARMRFIPQDFTNSDAVIRQRYQFTGLYLGYVINL